MSDVGVLALLAGGALLVFAALYAYNLNGQYRLRKEGRRQRGFPFSITFSRLYALLVVASLGVVLAFSNVDAAHAAAGFTLLGTIAGYLAGARPTEVSAAPPPNGPAVHEADGGGAGGGAEAVPPPHSEAVL